MGKRIRTKDIFDTFINKKGRRTGLTVSTTAV